ncbi:MAG: flagellar export chaperone FliS [Oscillospiraceae bacterium]|nr:flagellar export chaperone FliS [Oscillospiraceae bacterium]
MANPYAQYKQQSVKTMTPVEVVIKLYSEIEKQCAIGMDFVEKKNFAKSNEAFVKAEDCIDALRESLDMSIPISQNLDDLYVFFYNTIVKANINKDLTDLKKVVPMVTELRSAWTQVSQMTREEIEAQDKANKKKK